MSQYRAYEVVEVADKQYKGSVVEKNDSDLPDGELLIEVLYSSLNYKTHCRRVVIKGLLVTILTFRE